MTPYDAAEIEERSLARDEEGAVQAYRCASCQRELITNEKHPVATVADQRPTIVLFCSDSCRREWLQTDGDQP